MKFCSFVAVICVALCATAFVQQPLTNSSIEKMANAGLGDTVILSMIQNQPGNYDVSPDRLIALKQEGISDKVLAAMAAKTSLEASSTPAIVSNAYEDLDIGVYRKVRDAWIPIQTEQVNWKTGGVLKSIATDGIIKGDVNGRLRGGASATQMTNPLEFVIRAILVQV